MRSQGGPNARTPVAVLSASARPEDLRLGLDAGADAYLTKPIDFQALLDLLGAAGRGRSAMQGPALRQAAA